MSDTPRTDAFYATDCGGVHPTHARFARQLERELIDAKAKAAEFERINQAILSDWSNDITRLEKAMAVIAQADLICGFYDKNYAQHEMPFGAPTPDSYFAARNELAQLVENIKKKDNNNITPEKPKIEGWTGRKCPHCKGTGEEETEHSYRSCHKCAGTGDEYGVIEPNLDTK